MGLIEHLRGRSVYLDANVFIYTVEKVVPYVDALAPLIKLIAASEVRAVTSELTLAEVLVRPIADAVVVRQEEFQKAIRTQEGLTVVPISRITLIEAATLRAGTRSLRLPDAIHAATARLHGCAVFLTNDQRIQVLPDLELIQLAEL